MEEGFFCLRSITDAEDGLCSRAGHDHRSMSEYTTRQILEMIEENGGSEGLDLSGADLSLIDLSRRTIEVELEEARRENPEIEPVWVTLSGGINLGKANLQKAELWGANLEGANLEKANLQRAHLREVNLQGANLLQTDLEVASLLRANLQGANLWRAKLRGADLREANLQSVNLLGANLQGANLAETNLQEARLWEADLRGSLFRGARLDDTEIDQKSLGVAIGEELAKEYDQAREAYLRLKQNFDDLGDYAASAWAYQKERQMEKQCSAPWRARGIYGRDELRAPSPPRMVLFYARHTAKWVVDWIVEYLCGYGENATRVLLWMAVSLLGFASYYCSIGGIWLVDPGRGPTTTADSFWHYLIYSLGAFTTTQFARFQAADDRVRLFTGIQAIWGIFLAGLLGFVVANKIRRS